MSTIGQLLGQPGCNNRSKRQRLLLVTLLGCMSGCTTTYYHNDYHSHAYSQESPLPHKETYNEGLVALFAKETSIDIDAMCGQLQWKTIKTEASFVDVIIKAIANPIWGTYTVEYQCQSDRLADIASPPDLYSDSDFTSN